MSYKFVKNKDYWWTNGECSVVWSNAELQPYFYSPITSADEIGLFKYNLSVYAKGTKILSFRGEELPVASSTYDIINAIIKREEVPYSQKWVGDISVATYIEKNDFNKEIWWIEKTIRKYPCCTPSALYQITLGENQETFHHCVVINDLKENDLKELIKCCDNFLADAISNFNSRLPKFIEFRKHNKIIKDNQLCELDERDNVVARYDIGDWLYIFQVFQDGNLIEESGAEILEFKDNKVKVNLNSKELWFPLCDIINIDCAF